MKTFLAVAVGAGARGPLPGRARRRDDRATSTADDEAIENAVDQFLGTEGTPGARPAGEAPDGATDEEKPDGRQATSRSATKQDKPEQDFVGPPMDDSTEQGQRYANQLAQVKTQERRADGRVPDLLPDPARARLDRSTTTRGRS